MRRRELLRSLLGLPLVGSVPRLLAPSWAMASLGCDAPPKATALELDGELGGADLRSGHRLRDAFQAGLWQNAPTRRVKVAIVGGGPAGFSAAWQLRRRGIDDVHLFELESAIGGTSLSGRSEVSAYPWGAHYLPLPAASHRSLVELLQEMDALEGFDARGEPIGAESLLVREPEERVFYRGYWYRGLYPYAGASPDDLQELERFRKELDRLAVLRDGAGRPAFCLPLSQASDDSELYALDRLTAEQWLHEQGYRSERLRWLVDYACRDDYGLRASETSAWAALFYWAARIRGPGAQTADLLTWPEGNAALVEHLRRRAGARIEKERLACRIESDGEGATLHLLDTRNERTLKVVADRCIIAIPRFIARRIVAALADQEDEGFRYGPWLVANLHLAGRPRARGFGACWDNVLHDSPSLGYIEATHQRGRDFGSTVWTYYLPLADEEPNAARARLEQTPLQSWQEAIVEDLERAHPELRRHLRRLDVHRWGHAMVQPRPGFVSGLARRQAQRPLARVHFAHSDLSGLALFEEAFDHGLRAANEVADALAGAG